MHMEHENRTRNNNINNNNINNNNNNNNTGSSSTFSFGLSWMDIPQQSRMQEGGGNPLDLTSAIEREMQRSSTPAGWQYAWGSHPHQSPLQEPFGAFLSHPGNNNSLSLPQYYSIPRFEEAPGSNSGLPQDYHEMSAIYSRSTTSGFPSSSSSVLQLQHERVVDSAARGAAVCSPWIERMMQAEVAPTPCPSLGISTSLSLQSAQQRKNVSCLASDLHEWSENNRDQLQPRESISADLCTDDEDLETRPIDEKRKKRMLSNRASAQRSRQRRQERLDQLEVLTAQLRVENSTLQKKLSAAIQVAKKHEEQNTNLLKKVEKLSKELDIGKPKQVMAAAAAATAAFDECACSQQTTCASSCEMIGGRTSVDPSLLRDGNANDGASTPSGSPSWPSQSCPNENDMDIATSNGNNNNKAELSPLRRFFSACRVGKKRSFGESEIAGGSESTSIGNQMGSGGYLASSQPSRARLSRTGGETNGFSEPSAFANSFGLDATLEADRWFEFAECFK